MPEARNSTPPRRYAIYGAVNVVFLVAALIACVVGDSPNPRLFYLISLFAICSSSIIDLDGLNGRYSLLGMFLLNYFIMFGVTDFFAMARGTVTDPSSSMLSATEAVILVGGILVLLSYRLVLLTSPKLTMPGSVREWPLSAVVLLGFTLWTVGMYAFYEWYVHIITDATNEATRKGLQSVSAYTATAYILAQMVQPLGILLIAYAWRTYGLKLLSVPLLIMVVLQVLLGFVIDIKGFAMLGGVLVLVTIVLIEGRVPLRWIVVAVAYVVLVFPLFQTFRAEIRGNRGIARTAVIENFGKVLSLVFSAEDRVNSGRNRAQTFLERSSLRGSVQTIVEQTGNGVAYQYGHTLSPILATFIPKIIWSDKQEVPTGQLVNKEFHLSDSEDIYISPSHLGEFYWNFGWPGVIIGMSLVGGILGVVGARSNLADAKTVTRLLITVVTIKQVIISFEGAVAPSYVVYFRSIAGIALLHLMLAKSRVRRESPGLVNGSGSPLPLPLPLTGPGKGKAFPNLLS
jgi:hypothetical protein